MALDTKEEMVLRDGMLACGFTMPPHQLRTLMDFNAPTPKWTEPQWSLLASRLRSDRREMDDIHTEALDAARAHALWKKNRVVRTPRFFEHSFVNTPADPTGHRPTERQLGQATGEELDRIGAPWGRARHHGPGVAPEGDNAYRARLERTARSSTYSISEELGMRLHYAAAGWSETICSDCSEHFTGETHSCQ